MICLGMLVALVFAPADVSGDHPWRGLVADQVAKRASEGGLEGMKVLLSLTEESELLIDLTTPDGQTIQEIWVPTQKDPNLEARLIAAWVISMSHRVRLESSSSPLPKPDPESKPEPAPVAPDVAPRVPPRSEPEPSPDDVVAASDEPETLTATADPKRQNTGDRFFALAVGVTFDADAQPRWIANPHLTAMLHWPLDDVWGIYSDLGLTMPRSIQTQGESLRRWRVPLMLGFGASLSSERLTGWASLSMGLRASNLVVTGQSALWRIEPGAAVALGLKIRLVGDLSTGIELRGLSWFMRRSVARDGTLFFRSEFLQLASQVSVGYSF